MSILRLKFKASGISGSVNGALVIVINNGGENITLIETLSDFSTSNRFAYSIPSNGVFQDIVQADNYAQAINRDYKNVFSNNNVSVILDDDEVDVVLNEGVFVSWNYSGDRIQVTEVSLENTPIINSLELNHSITNTGDCNSIDFIISASGGMSPYILSDGINVLDADWDGLDTTVSVARGTQKDFHVDDSQLTRKTTTINSPRKLASGEFDVAITQFQSSSDIAITNTNPVANVGTIEYSLNDLSVTAGTLVFQTSNVYQGVLPGSYKLSIRDGYGCIVSKVITVSELQDATDSDNPRYFEINKLNPLIFSECAEFNESVKKNFDNTLSFNELSGIKYEIAQSFNEKDRIGIQFKSSYPYHIITLHDCTGTKFNLSPVMVQENLGSKEKVDCKFFQINGKTAVYFDGGNEYEPNTTTVIGASEYTQFTPDWVQTGQIVTIDTLGTFTIDETGYSEDLARSYFLINVTTSLTEGMIQVTRNVQPYNLFEFYFNISQITNTARIVIEKGFAFDQIDGNAWLSELIKKEEDSEDYLLIEASSIRNRGGLVFQSGIQFKNRIRGKFRSFFEGDVENYDGDSRIYPLTENFYQRYRLELDFITARQAYLYGAWAVLDGFKVNNVPLRALNFPEIEELGDSNFYSFKVDLGYTGNIVAEQQDEIVLNVSTGIVGGGVTNGVNQPLPNFDGKTRLVIDGGFFTVDGMYISV